MINIGPIGPIFALAISRSDPPRRQSRNRSPLQPAPSLRSLRSSLPARSAHSLHPPHRLNQAPTPNSSSHHLQALSAGTTSRAHSNNAGSFGSPRCFRLRVRESSCYVLLRINDADNRAISRRVFAFERKTRFLAATPEHQLTDARAN